MDTEMRDSGDRRVFTTGAVRDTGEGKPRPDLISAFFRLRLGAWMARGAKKYCERNWEKGMPLSVFLASLHRHLAQFEAGLRDEDHLAAIAFNVMGLIHGEEMLDRRVWPRELGDLPRYASPGRERETSQ
jgi:hypothetical protein